MKLIFLFYVLFTLGALAASGIEQKNLIKEKTKIENPFNLRDPFKAPQVKNDNNRHGKGFKVSDKGEYSNIEETQLGEVSLNNIRVVGVLIGRERRVMINIGKEDQKKIIIMKEGMKIGPDNAELKAILPGGIVLVEKIVNVYGEDEFLETVIPISK
jgi:type IV pilus assembly protein PilP